MLAEALALGSAGFAGGSHAAAKLAIQRVPPSVFLAVKWATSGAIFSAVVLVTGAWTEFRWNHGALAVVAASLIGPMLAWSLYTRALLLVDLVVAFTVSQLHLLWAILIAMVALGERPNAFTGLGAAGIIAGAALVQPFAGRKLGAATSPDATLQRRAARQGVLLALGTSLAWGVNDVLFKVAAVNVPILQATWTRTAIPGMLWALAFLYVERSRRHRGLTARALAPAGVAFSMTAALLTDVLEWTMVFTALAIAPVAVVFPLTGTTPLFTALFARFVLHEPISRRQALGIGLVVAGVALVAALGSG